MNRELVDELVRLMRANPVEALAAIREARPASEWRERNTVWSCWRERVGAGGDAVAFVYADERGRVFYQVPGVDVYMAVHEADSVEAGMAACDALLVGWALGAGGGAP